MTGEADLSGHRILVVEDDYYLATDTARALQGAGAEVIGPCPSEEAARDALEEGAPAAALVDINLARGRPSPWRRCCGSAACRSCSSRATTRV